MCVCVCVCVCEREREREREREKERERERERERENGPREINSVFTPCSLRNVIIAPYPPVFQKQNFNNNNNHIQRRYSKFFTISS